MSQKRNKKNGRPRSTPEVFAVVFPSTIEYNGPGRHVDTHGESFGGKEDLDQTSTEANFHDLLFENAQENTTLR